MLAVNVQNLTIIVAAIAIFGLVLSVGIAVIVVRSARQAKRTDRLESRLGLHDERDSSVRVLRLWRDGHEATTTVPGKARRVPIGERLERLRQKTGWRAPARSILLGVLGSAALLSLIALVVTTSWLAAAGTAAVALLGFWIYVKQRVRRTEVIFERQFLDALGLASQSLRAGHPLTGAFKLIADEIGPPIGVMFADMCQRQALGLDLEDAIREVSETSDSHDMRIFATSVAIQLRSGGNLVEMMERLSVVIRDRMRLTRRVRVLTAQTQFSKRVLLALPLFVFAAIMWLNPGYIRPLLDTPKGNVLLAIAGGGLLLGWWVMSRMSKLQY